MKKIYESWLKRTKQIDCDCSYCGNQRYTIDISSNFKLKIYACPSCNFEDLQITKNVSEIPLHKFVMVKNGTLDINSL